MVTAIPLLLFATAAKNIPLSTLGLLQYIAPTLQFFVGVLMYGEEFSQGRLVGFSIIWLALLIFSLSSVFQRRRATTSSAVESIKAG